MNASFHGTLSTNIQDVADIPVKIPACVNILPSLMSWKKITKLSLLFTSPNN